VLIFGRDIMTIRPHSKTTVSKMQKVKRKSIFLLLFFVPAALIAASFSVIAVAQDNVFEKDSTFWMNNREQLITDYQNNDLSSQVAGVIQFDEKNIVPIYNSIENAEVGASLFGSTLPGETGRCIIMGHQEQDFVYLSKIAIGDEIVVDSYNGECIYVVEAIEVVVPSEIPFEETDKSVLTLVSQYPFRSLNLANRRYVVEAVLLN